MRCPYCSDPANRVIDSRLGRDGAEIRRRRECLECGRRFTTRERVDGILPRVVKRNDDREEFNREKVLEAVQRASQKRSVDREGLERLVDRVERHFQELGEREVTSRLVGERVLEELVGLDPMAAARFASVFLGFQGPEDYAEFFAAAFRSKSGSRSSP